jgi:hypothetical protein
LRPVKSVICARWNVPTLLSQLHLSMNKISLPSESFHSLLPRESIFYEF